MEIVRKQKTFFQHLENAMTNESSTIQNNCDNHLKYYGILHIVISNTKV